MEMENGKHLALQALSGIPSDRIPVALFTWEFDYVWKIAGIEPWQLACGGSSTWHKSHIGLLDRHLPDLLFYSGAGTGAEEPTLLEENADAWIVRDNNTNDVYKLTKESYSKCNLETGAQNCDPVGIIKSYSDADQLIPRFNGFQFEGCSKTYLEGLGNLVKECGGRALILPHHSPAYICTCYSLGFERAMEMIIDEPELFTYICEMFDSTNGIRMKQLADAGAEAVFIADGWASCDIISPEMYERFALPYQISITKAAHEAGLPVILWNEGDILPILELQASVEVDALAFEQPRKGIDISVEKVRKVFGRNRCLFGNLDSELLLLRNDTREIKQKVEDQILQSGKNAPFIFSTGSPIPSDVQPEAVDTFINQVREHR